MLPILRRRDIPSLWDNEVDRLFDFALGGGSSYTGLSPAVDVRETADDFLVTAELPGLSRDDVDVSVENGVLSISGEKREEFEEGSETGNRHLIERRYGKFHRNFSLPRSVDAEKVEARFDNGVLHVTLPKAAVAKARRVKIG